MSEQLTIVGLGGSVAHTSRSLAALKVALDGAAEAGAATTLLICASSICRCTTRRTSGSLRRARRR
jgi:hypothetical protein